MQLIRIALTGKPVRAPTDNGHATAAIVGLLGVDVTARDVEGEPRTVVQLLFDDDRAGFDRTLLDGPLVAELTDRAGDVRAREPFDHDRFRRQLRAERDAGESTTRGVLVLTDGALPPAWIRLAFLPVALAATAGWSLAVLRTTVAELTTGVEQAYSRGEITDDERRAVLTSIEQRHPGEL